MAFRDNFDVSFELKVASAAFHSFLWKPYGIQQQIFRLILLVIGFEANLTTYWFHSVD